VALTRRDLVMLYHVYITTGVTVEANSEEAYELALLADVETANVEVEECHS